MLLRSSLASHCQIPMEMTVHVFHLFHNKTCRDLRIVLELTKSFVKKGVFYAMGGFYWYGMGALVILEVAMHLNIGQLLILADVGPVC